MMSMQVPGRQAARRHGAPQDPRRGLDRPAAAAADDPQQRELHRPSTAATLNLAAAAAQGARLFAPLRPASRPSARRGAARLRRGQGQPGPVPAGARRRPAPAAAPYDDDDVTDEFYWAAAELYLTTGEQAYLDDVLASPHHTADIFASRRLRAGARRRRSAASTSRPSPNVLPAATADPRSRWSTAPSSTWRAQAAQAFGTPTPGRRRTSTSGAPTAHPQQPGRAGHRVRPVRRRAVPRRACWRRWTTCSAATRSTTPTSPATARCSSENQHSRMFAARWTPSLPHPPPGSVAGGPNRRRTGTRYRGAVLADQLRAAVLLRRRHRVVVDQRDHGQLELGAGLGGLLPRRPAGRRPVRLRVRSPGSSPIPPRHRRPRHAVHLHGVGDRPPRTVDPVAGAAVGRRVDRHPGRDRGDATPSPLARPPPALLGWPGLPGPACSTARTSRTGSAASTPTRRPSR